MRPTRFEILVLFVVLGLGAYVFVPLIQQNRIRAQQQACIANLQSIGVGISGYLSSNDSTWPCVDKLKSYSRREPAWPTLPEVLKTFVKDDRVYHCPADSRQVEDEALIAEFGANATWFETEGLSYEWIWPESYGGRKVGEEKLSRIAGRNKGRADQDLLRDFEAFHVGVGFANTLFADFVARPGSSGDE